MSKRHFATVIASVIGGSSLFAQSAKDSTFKQLDQVVVTATKYPVKESLTGKVLTVITKEQLEKSGGKQLTEILNTQAGVVVNGSQNTLGTEQDIYLQGADAGKTLILIDGIPAYDPSGTSTALDLNLINTDEVERVEILKGSQSTIYGSDAVAGVINIITRKGEGGLLNASLNLSAGSFGTWKTSAGIDGKIGNTGYNLQYTHLQSDGRSSAYDSSGKGNFDNDGFHENLVLFNINHKLTDALQIRGNFLWSHYNNDIDAFAYTDDKLYTVKNNNIQVGAGVDYRIGAALLHLNYNYNTVTRNYQDDSATLITQGGFYSKSSYSGKSHFAELYTNIDVSPHVALLAGMDYRNQRLDESGLDIFQDYMPPYEIIYDSSRISVDSAKVVQVAGYASVLLKDLGGFNLELGGRYNNFNRYGNVFTYSINPSYVMNDRVKFFANLSSGFSAPTLYQLYSQLYRNPFGDLKPERTVSVETGIQYSVRHANARVLYFQRSTKDNIIFYTDPNYVSYYINQDRQKDHGFEFEGSLKTGQWSFSGNYTYTAGKVTTPVNGKDSSFNNLYRRPKNAVNLTAGFQANKAFFISLALRAVGKRIESVYGGPPSNFDTYAYYTLDGYVEYKLCRQLKAFADLKNLTNQLYFDSPGYNSLGFNFMAGISLHL
jgi:vitamin B12 transporter